MHYYTIELFVNLTVIQMQSLAKLERHIGVFDMCPIVNRTQAFIVCSTTIK